MPSRRLIFGCSFRCILPMIIDGSVMFDGLPSNDLNAGCHNKYACQARGIQAAKLLSAVAL